MLLLAGMSLSASAATFISSSKITVTDTYTGPTCEAEMPLDAFSLFDGHTGTEIVATNPVKGQTYGPVYAAGQGSYVFLNSKTVTLSNLYNSTDLDPSVILDSFSFITRTDGNVTNGLYMQVCDSEGAVLGTSSLVSYNTNATTSNSLYGVGTFSFANEIILNSSASYIFKLVNEDLSDYVGNVQMGVANMTYFSTQGGGYQLDGTTQYQTAIISIATHSVPEPATASLSLLGLVALMMRRRRA